MNAYQIKDLDHYRSEYNRSIEDPEGFWSGIADHFSWKRKWDKVLEWNFEEPSVKWFSGGRLNITENCIDRHLEKLSDSPAIIWEPNNPNENKRVLTYSDLHREVSLFANVLKANGIKKGDRVCIYMPMVPELPVAMLACARIGAIHSVVFGGFSAQSISDRISDASCKMVITADGAFRANKVIPLKDIIDDALLTSITVEKVIVLSRAELPVSMIKGRDYWWHDEMRKMESAGMHECEAEPMDSEDMLFILYTSGSTGKPKGVVHTTAGYMVWTNYTFVNVFQYQPGEIHFCTADIGWITGHSYIVYGPLSAGATTLMFEGVPTYPDASRLWQITEKHKVNILYTAPTAIRGLMAHGDSFLEGFDLSTLRVLGTVGEPINEEAWQWYYKKVGKETCPVTDTWWQTETGGVMIANLAGVTPAKPAYATLPLPGIQPVIMDEKGNVKNEQETSGNLCISFPWPGMLRTTYGDHERCRLNYFSAYPGNYFTGDGCFRDQEGNYRITGRVDDVLNVSGHRIGTAEVENAINMHTGVIESAVVGFPHPVKGQGIYAFVIFESLHVDPALTHRDINETVARIIGPIAKPDRIQFVSGLPKTRSGKIMRRILRKIAAGESDLGDTSTLLDPQVVEEIREGSKNG